MPTPQTPLEATETPKPSQNPHEKTPRVHVYASVLDYIRALRTSPTMNPDEALEWVTLEQEFTNRIADEKENSR